jgi:WhiB family transcriptional regulator, redox-sensing transcriptional regulator
MPRTTLGLGGRQEVNTAMMLRHIAEGTDDQSWQASANCLGVDPDLFFPERGASTREAKEVCRGCIVRDECLEYALRNGEKFGIWGGMSERERRRIRRQRALARTSAAEQPSA